MDYANGSPQGCHLHGSLAIGWLHINRHARKGVRVACHNLRLPTLPPHKKLACTVYEQSNLDTDTCACTGDVCACMYSPGHLLTFWLTIVQTTSQSMIPCIDTHQVASSLNTSFFKKLFPVSLSPVDQGCLL